uniref:Endoplasmic reticulum-Golgi intermediate compartment protein 2 n=1 Tax=Macrostomum lignano TaxID=282301 RepID=A0A1I8I331_9PLAT
MSNISINSHSAQSDTELRHRNVPSAPESAAKSPVSEEMVKAVRKLDVFTKLPEDCRSSGTASGAGITLVTFLLMFLLVCVEVNNYMERRVQFAYGVDPDHSAEMLINVDLVVASPCVSIGMDVLDITGTETHGTSELEEIPTDFELDESSRNRFSIRQHMQEAIRQHHHALQSDLFADKGWLNVLGSEQFQSPNERKAASACRLRGRFRVNKVAGNLHLTGGKPVNFGGTHAHFQASHATALNFSHRIYHLSFGEDVPGRINPLDYEEKVTQHASTNYQYFVQVVPTELHRRGLSAAAGATVRSFQYAVQELDRVIDHGRGSHGLPGLFFKYEVSPLQVVVKDAGLPLSSFLTNLAAITGGVFACSALLCYLVNAAWDRLCRSMAGRGSSHLPVVKDAGIRNPGVNWTRNWRQLATMAIMKEFLGNLVIPMAKLNTILSMFTLNSSEYLSDTELRHRNVPSAPESAAKSPVSEEMVKAVRKLDVFTKLPEDCRSSGTASAAGITLVTFLLMFLLVCVEVNNYMERRVQFAYGVDPDHSAEMLINVDLVVASPCVSIGMDVLDITGTETHGTSELEEIPTDFELDESSRNRFSTRQHMQSPNERKAASACRLRGRFRVNKVAGNLHLTGGKPVNFGATHAHFQDVPGRINPLDYEEKVTQHASTNYQYFVQVVPTELHRRGLSAAAGATVRSFQYAVQELDRVIDHGRGSHGLPGLFFKYEVSPLQVVVKDAGLPLSSFLTNLAAITGGVFACSALLCYLVNAAWDRLCRAMA